MPSFTQDIETFVKKTRIKGETVLKKLAFDAFAGVMKKSPVDTGRFRSNWRIGINTVDLTYDPIPPTGGIKKGRGGQHYDVATGRFASRSVSSIEGGLASSKIETAKWGDYIAITNSTPYGPRLEEGYSRQAPLGMVRITFEEVKAGLERAVASVQ